MKILERQIQKINIDKWAELEANEPKWDALESRLGFPSKRRYRAISGANDMSTLIIEREWNSMAEMEAAYDKVMQEPDYQALVAASSDISKKVHFELYAVL